MPAMHAGTMRFHSKSNVSAKRMAKPYRIPKWLAAYRCGHMWPKKQLKTVQSMQMSIGKTVSMMRPGESQQERHKEGSH